MDALVSPWQELGDQLDAALAPLSVPFAPVNAALVSAVGEDGAFPLDQLRFVTCVLLSMPLGWLFRALPQNAALKHLFSIVTSISFLIFCIGPSAWVHSFVSSLVVYLLLAVLPARWAHKAAFGFAMLFMSLLHIYRITVDWMGWSMDVTASQMVLTIKLTSFAFNVWDGRRMAMQRAGQRGGGTKLTEKQAQRAVTSMPSLLEFFGFVYFFPSFLAGPAIEFTEYRDFVRQSGAEDAKTPSSVVPALVQLVRAALFVPFLVIYSKNSVFGDTTVPYLATEAFTQLPWWEQAVRLYVNPTISRMKYYFAWYLAECGFIACGVGYNPATRKWNRFANAVWWRVEFAPNMQSVTTYWNMRTADWLKNYVYLRLTPAGQRPTLASTAATYAMSAFWHGFYPGYYLFFLTMAVFTECAKDLRKLIRPKFVNDAKPSSSMQFIYDVLTTLFTSVFCNYAGVSFVLLDARLGLRLYSHLYYWGHILSILALILLRTVLKPARPPRPAAGASTAPAAGAGSDTKPKRS